MSAAATAAGYLYASGRLRGRNAREGQEGQPGEQAERRRPKVAVYAPELPQAPARPKKTPTIQYRTRRWKPNGTE